MSVVCVRPFTIVEGDGFREMAKHFISIGATYVMSIISQLHHVLPILRSKLCHEQRRRSLKSDVFTRCLLATIERLPSCGFPVTIFIWSQSAYRRWEDDPQYYQVTSIV